MKSKLFKLKWIFGSVLIGLLLLFSVQSNRNTILYIWNFIEPLSVTASAESADRMFYTPTKNVENCVLLLHGMGASPQLAWSKLFHRQRDDLRLANYLFVAPEMNTRIKESKWNFIDIQSALENHLQEMFPSCSKWQIWGNSLGGWLAIDFYSRNPVKFYKVVAFNPVGLDLEVPLLKNVFNSPTGAKMRDLHERTFAQPLELPNFFWSFLAWGLSLAGEKIPAGKSDFALDPFLNRAPNKLPIHIVWGQSDRLIPHFLPEFKKYSKKIQIHEIPNCGHTPQTECLPEVLNLVLDD
jgi:pimeloyl-ACP methyl ester carboxylesterase